MNVADTPHLPFSAKVAIIVNPAISRSPVRIRFPQRNQACAWRSASSSLASPKYKVLVIPRRLSMALPARACARHRQSQGRWRLALVTAQEIRSNNSRFADLLYFGRLRHVPAQKGGDPAERQKQNGQPSTSQPEGGLDQAIAVSIGQVQKFMKSTHPQPCSCCHEC